MKKRTWDGIYKEKGIVQKETHPLVLETTPFLEKKGVKSILDLGCGTGRNTIYLAQKGFKVTGVDISSVGLEILQGRLKKEGLKNVVLKKANILNLPFADQSFDAVMCISTLHHFVLKDIKKVIKEIWGISKPGGIVVANILSPKDSRFSKGKEIESHTFIGGSSLDSDVPHHFFFKAEVKSLFKKFKFHRFDHVVLHSSPPFAEKALVYWYLVLVKEGEEGGRN